MIPRPACTLADRGNDAAVAHPYVPGAADVLQTYGYWRSGRPDPTQLHETYSGQFFSLCRSMGWEALVLSSAERCSALREPGIEIRQRPIPFERSHWVLYHVGQVWVVEVAADDPREYARAIVRLRHDPELYAAKRMACQAHQSQFYDTQRSWSAVLREIVETVTARRKASVGRG